MIELVSTGWDFNSSVGSDWVPPEIDTSVAHSARVYDFILGGKDNFPADREAAKLALAGYPALGTAMRENRAMLRRAVHFLAGEAGVRQFLDVGTGIPTSPNVHEVAQAVAPSARVVYTDNDPIVLAHARALLTSSPEGRTTYLDADLRDPAKIVDKAREVLDFHQPIALLVFGVLMFVPNAADPHGIIAGIVDTLPSGSYLALTHPSTDLHPKVVTDAVAASYERSGIPFQFRTKDEIARFFSDLELVEPGIVPMAEWRADSDAPPAENAGAFGGVARKP